MASAVSIGRTITQTHCKGVRLTDKGFVPFEDTLYGDYTPQRASKKLRTERGDQTIAIEKCETRKIYCKMSVDNFIKYADEVTEKE